MANKRFFLVGPFELTDLDRENIKRAMLRGISAMSGQEYEEFLNRVAPEQEHRLSLKKAWEEKIAEKRVDDTQKGSQASSESPQGETEADPASRT